MHIDRSLNYILGISFLLATLGLNNVACNPVQFSTEGNKSNPCLPEDSSCVVTPKSKVHYDYDIVTSSPKVDILIIDDNSASMSFEQRHLANRFVNFINFLESRPIDYQIAITTTDISSSVNPPRSINGNGALQDGNLVSFSNGNYILNSSSGTLQSKVSMFERAIVRPETLACENFITNWVNLHGKSSMDSSTYQNLYKTNCPSGDERGLYALAKVIQKNPRGFLRPGANLAVIVISDEDERSQYYEPFYGMTGFALEALDQPVEVLKVALNGLGPKSFVVHSLVVKDLACKKTQDLQLAGGVVSGSYGNQYAKISKLTGGVVGDICAADQTYTDQVGAIAASVALQVQSLTLKCASPQSLQVLINGKNNNAYVLNGSHLKFNFSLASGTKVHVSYNCL